MQLRRAEAGELRFGIGVRLQPVVKVWRRTETSEALGASPRRQGATTENRGPHPRVVCAVGWQYREYLKEEQRRWRRGPQRGSRVGVAWGCIARRMQPDFHHGLLTARGENDGRRAGWRRPADQPSAVRRSFSEGGKLRAPR